MFTNANPVVDDRTHLQFGFGLFAKVAFGELVKCIRLAFLPASQRYRCQNALGCLPRLLGRKLARPDHHALFCDPPSASARAVFKKPAERPVRGYADTKTFEIGVVDDACAITGSDCVNRSFGK